MAKHESMAPGLSDERNLLFYKVGKLGNAPLNFMPELAEDYDAVLLSSDEIRWRLIQERDNEGLERRKAQRINLNKIKKTITQQASEALEKSDVVVDMFCNTQQTRASMKKVAHQAGAAAVALWVITNPRLPWERVKAWTDEDSFIVPVDRWGVSPTRAAGEMIRTLQNPLVHEADYLLTIDGDGDTEDLTNQVAQKLAALGLIEPDD